MYFCLAFCILRNAVDSVYTANTLCMASILNFQSCDLKHGGTFRYYCSAIILSNKYLVKLKEKVRRWVH